MKKVVFEQPSNIAGIKAVWHSSLWLKVFSILSIGLIIGGFLCPPLAVIDGSVLIATGELFAFAALFEVSKAIDNGLTARLRHGDTEVSVTKDSDRCISEVQKNHYLDADEIGIDKDVIGR